MNLLDDSLSADRARAGALDAAMTSRFLTLADYAVATGAKGLLFTCSAFGPCIDAVARRHAPLPVLKPCLLYTSGVSAGGSEEASMRVLDVKSGRQLGPIIDRTRFGGISWSRDGRQIYFHRMQALKKGAPPTDKYQRSMACVMPAGGRERSIRVLLRAGDKGPIQVPATEFPFIEIMPDGRAIASAMDGVSSDCLLYTSRCV